MKRAFTLIEIMVVVAVIAIIIGISVPTFRAFFNKAPLERAISDVEVLCREARSKAIQDQRSMDLIINDAENTLTLSTAARVVRQPDEFTGKLVRSTQEAEKLTQVTLETELEVILPEPDEPGADVQIRFYPNGTAETLELVVSSTEGGYRLVIDPVTGHAKVADVEDR